MAKRLLDKFAGVNWEYNDESGFVPNETAAKESALICVDEILDGFRKILPSSRSYWEEVKEEINKL